MLGVTQEPSGEPQRYAVRTTRSRHEKRVHEQLKGCPVDPLPAKEQNLADAGRQF